MLFEINGFHSYYYVFVDISIQVIYTVKKKRFASVLFCVFV